MNSTIYVEGIECPSCNGSISAFNRQTLFQNRIILELWCDQCDWAKMYNLPVSELVPDLSTDRQPTVEKTPPRRQKWFWENNNKIVLHKGDCPPNISVWLQRINLGRWTVLMQGEGDPVFVFSKKGKESGSIDWCKKLAKKAINNRLWLNRATHT